MRTSAIRLLALLFATAMLVGDASVTRASGSEQTRKHQAVHRRHQVQTYGLPGNGSGHPRPADRAWAARPAGPSGQICPGLARSFDCKIWPPPFDDDPDRKMSGADGG